MSSQTLMSLMCWMEFALWALVYFQFRTKKLTNRFPIMGAYLALRVATMPVLLFLFYAQSRHWFNNYSFDMYFYCYYAVYVASSVLLYFICVEVFRVTLTAFPGLKWLGTVAFRWAALVSVLLSLSTLTFEHARILLIPDIAEKLMRSVSIIEICLLAFLCLSMNALRLSTRDLAFGIALGFGMMSTSDFILSAFVSRNATLTDPIQFAIESMILLSLGIWVVYAALPEPVRKPVLMPADSLLLRWNEIATALGHTGTQVAVQQPNGNLLLTDVERAAVGVLAQNLKGNESEP